MTGSSHALALLLGERPPRADAERNVSALLEATRELVIDGDLNPSAAQIAGAAGVGVGTLYRRALSKEALLAAAVIDLLDDVCEAADAHDTSASWEGFEAFAIEYLRIREITCSITHALEEEFDGGVSAAKERTRAAFTRLTQRLRDGNYLDKAVDAADLMVLMASIDITDETLGLDPDNARRQRVVRRLLSSLRFTK
ncbi:TetR/AcrR family transcriptional regulator [Microbacterium sp. No. 7]|uniref:TetR/AcrR family transcriptional regulator n=1 Tax=Microbacterium sp. No. 7 TaxID=1714373 RepID=UPI0006CFFFD8|nr:TetR/AcrR family transcriptional regulator [Microbacterium sp. No. 7]ALJ18412.1 TetR family transcriptional regulator [Microbacterium sp. No. 7]